MSETNSAIRVDIVPFATRHLSVTIVDREPPAAEELESLRFPRILSGTTAMASINFSASPVAF